MASVVGSLLRLQIGGSTEEGRHFCSDRPSHALRMASLLRKELMKAAALLLLPPPSPPLSTVVTLLAAVRTMR
jgi:hypothetical protein